MAARTALTKPGGARLWTNPWKEFRPMRRAQWATTVGTLAGALLLMAVTGCGESTNPSGSGDTLSAAETSDIGAAEGDEVDQSVEALEVEGTTRWQCATVDNTTDSDGDGA